MKRVLLTVLVVALLASQASASMYILDKTTAKLFTQQNADVSSSNQLFLSIDNPGTFGSPINYTIDPDAWFEYGGTMANAVGFVGNLAATKLIGGVRVNQVMRIGLDGDLPGNDGVSMDSLAVKFSNDDNNDNEGVRLYLMGVSYDVPAFTILTPGATAFLTLNFLPGTVTEFGFELDYPGSTGSDNFHISVVPIPAALLLGLLGMGAAGLKLRRFA